MGRISWERRVLTHLEGVYCVELLHTREGLKIAAASEIHGGWCKVVDFATCREEVVWTGPGGCMNISQLNEAGDLIGIQLLDHIVIGDGCYCSLKKEGML